MPKRRNPGGNGKRNVGRKASPPAIIRPIQSPPRVADPQAAISPTSHPDRQQRPQRQQRPLSGHPLLITVAALLTVGLAEFALIVGMESIRIGFAPALHQTARRTIQVIVAPLGGLSDAAEGAREVLTDGTMRVPEQIDELERESENAKSP